MNAEPPSAPEILSFLERFQKQSRSFAEREKGLERARQLRESGRRANLEEQRAGIEREHRAAVESLRDEAAADVAALEELSTRRRARIDRGQIAVRNAVITAIQSTVGQQRAALQRDYMEAGRRREQSIAAANASFEAQNTTAKNLHSRFAKLEKAALVGLRGYGSLQRRLLLSLKDTETPFPGGRNASQLEAELSSRFDVLQASVKRLRKSPLTAWFSGFPLVLQIFILLALGGVAPLVAPYFGLSSPSWVLTLGIAGGVSVLILLLWMAGRGPAHRFAEEEIQQFAEAKALRLRHREELDETYHEAVKTAEAEYERVKSAFEQGLKQKTETSAGGRYAGPEAVEKRAADLRARLDRHREWQIDSLHQRLAEDTARIEQQRDAALAAASRGGGEEEDPALPHQRLVAEWKADFAPLAARLHAEDLTASSGSPFAWLAAGPEAWSPPRELLSSLAFGELAYSGERSELLQPVSPEMKLSFPADFRLPLRLGIPGNASLLLETKQQGRDEAIALLNYLVLGWLAQAPAGRLSFSLFDPVGLGESFAGLMHLADYEEILINTRIRTQPDQIERRIGELCDHMEKVIQMYLRNDYATITEYNEAAGTIAERYHFLVVADFPHGFSDLAVKRLLSIAASGARCGVFLLIHGDQRAATPAGMRMDDLRKACLCLQSGLDGFFIPDAPVKGLSLSLTKPPATDLFARWIHRIGEANRDSNRIEVPFSFIAPAAEECWSRSTSSELRVPIGRSGATKLQELALGKGTCQHALIAGKTGSGKSTLFHIIVSNLALWHSPDEVEFYLIDFKKGVEFKCYADHALPHARVIAIESDREFGLSVLQRLDEELRRRGELFRATGVQDLASYRSRPGSETMPRSLLLIDEFQEFFTEDDAISQQAAVLLDRIVRQGRAFGIHVILGSQTLGGAFTLARATLGQMTVRIALACNEADAYLIMDDSNPAPRLLTRPGEGIYNDRAGAAEANSPFQVVWLGEAERDQLLDHVAALDEGRGAKARPRVVFEGNAPAEVEKDAELSLALRRSPTGGKLRFFLGAPNSIKGPTEVSFSRQSGSHLLLVGQREDAVDALVLVALKMLRTQFENEIRLVLIDSRFAAPDASPFRRAVENIGGIECPDAHGMGTLLNELAASLKAVADGSATDSGKPVVLFIPNLHRHRKLRHEEDFSFSLDADAEAKPSDSLQEIILEGPPWGYHLVTSVDSYNNVTRTLGRKAAGEFEKKVLFQMSAADSASLIDSGKASELGLNRALLYDEAAGTLEIFRPYAMPGMGWFG
ncbi:MAG: ATP-binding protein [Verrucomicrobiae bacterium]|nr:ATP-binding protein [Verrucomicrobiae bacterium]